MAVVRMSGGVSEFGGGGDVGWRGGGDTGGSAVEIGGQDQRYSELASEGRQYAEMDAGVGQNAGRRYYAGGRGNGVGNVAQNF